LESVFSQTLEKQKAHSFSPGQNLVGKPLTGPSISSFSDLNADKKPSPLPDLTWTLIQLLQ